MFEHRTNVYNAAQYLCIEKIFRHVVWEHVETFDTAFSEEFNRRMSVGLPNYKPAPKLYAVLGEKRFERNIVEAQAYSAPTHKKFNVRVYASGDLEFQELPCCDCLFKYKTAPPNIHYNNPFARYIWSGFGYRRTEVPSCTPVVKYVPDTFPSMFCAPFRALRDHFSRDEFRYVDKTLFGWDAGGMRRVMARAHARSSASRQLATHGIVAKLHGWGMSVEEMRKTTNCISDMNDFARVLGVYDGKMDDWIPTIVTVLYNMEATTARRYYGAVRRCLPPVVGVLIERPA
jgi:hypothetical protein